jgi:myxalamid-type polyketide synthase MxaB
MLRLMGARRPALLGEIATEVEQAGGAAPASRVDQAFRRELAAADDASRRALVRDYIRTELARIMGVATESLEADRPLSTFGLDSLLALELKNNLEGRLDFTLPMAKLMEGPTIASLAEATVELIFGASGPVAADGVSEAKAAHPLAKAVSPGELWAPLVALRAGGSRPPLVFLPALGGDSGCYVELAQQLGDDQPVYAFRPRGIDQDLPPHRSMEEMVADYAAALRVLQSEGPYRLAGWSTGGIYAFALAEALERAGDEVALVALFGTPIPAICDDVDPDDDARFLCDLVNFANCFAGTHARVDYEELLALEPEARFQTALAEARRQGTVPAGAPEAYIRRLVHVGEANIRVIQSCAPRPLAAPVHLFVPTRKGGLAQIAGREWDEQGDHGWGREIGQAVELFEVPGDHFTMMVGEGAAQIARRLKPLLTPHGGAKQPSVPVS